jgi:outer membrane receptor protein involved in Fe transport
MSAGMEKTGRGEMDVSTRKIAFAGGFSMHDFGDVLAGDSLGLLVPTAYQENAFDAKVILRTSASSLLTASYQYDKQKEVPRYDQVTQGGFKFYNFDPQQRQLGYVRWETLTKSRWFQSLRFTTSFNQTLEVIKAQKNSAVDYKENQDKVHTTGMIAEVQSNPLTGWSIQSGMEYYYDKVNSTATIINSATNSETTVRGSYADGATSSNMAIYSNHQYDRTNYQINGGIRFNAVTVSVEDIIFGNQEIRPNAFVGQFGAMWKINTALRMYAHANTGFRAPNVDDMSKFGAVETGVFEIPASGLSPEKSFTIESGIKFKKPKYTGAFSVYQTQLDDLIDRVPATYQGSSSIEGRTVYQKQNVGEAIVKGIEADFGWTFLKSFTLTANATYTYGQNITKDEPMRRIPPLFGRMNLHYQHHSGWWLRGEWVTAGSQDRLAAGDKSDVRISIRLVDGAMPGWNIFNLYTGYTYKSFTFNVAAQNIFDKAYRVYASGIDGYGRSMLASLQIRF